MAATRNFALVTILNRFPHDSNIIENTYFRHNKKSFRINGTFRRLPTSLSTGVLRVSTQIPLEHASLAIEMQPGNAGIEDEPFHGKGAIAALPRFSAETVWFGEAPSRRWWKILPDSEKQPRSQIRLKYFVKRHLDRSDAPQREPFEILLKKTGRIDCVFGIVSHGKRA